LRAEAQLEQGRRTRGFGADAVEAQADDSCAELLLDS
jgi:hypothetical protein